MSTMKYEIHQAAKRFPLMTDEEFQGLRQDIEDHGQREPIVVCKGKVLDGRNRLRACQELKIEPAVREWANGKEGDSPTAFVISANLHRRHLTPTQKAVIAAEITPLFRTETLAIQRSGGRSGGKQGGRGKKKPLAEKNSKGLDTVEKKATAKAAASVKVSESLVTRAKRVIKKAPDLKEPLLDGTITISGAQSIIEFEPDERKDVIERIQSGDAKDVKTAVIHMSEEGHCPKALNPSFEATHDFGSKWQKAIHAIKIRLNSIRMRGGIERFTSQWSDERKQKTAIEMHSLVTEIQGFISFLEGGSNGKG